MAEITPEQYHHFSTALLLVMGTVLLIEFLAAVFGWYGFSIYHASGLIYTLLFLFLLFGALNLISALLLAKQKKYGRILGFISGYLGITFLQPILISVPIALIVVQYSQVSLAAVSVPIIIFEALFIAIFIGLLKSKPKKNNKHINTKSVKTL